MVLPYLTEKNIERFIELALAEDVGDGDHSSQASVPKETISKAKLIIKDAGIIAGIELSEKIFSFIDPDLKVEVLIKDGSQVNFGDIGLTVFGNARSILKSERLVLNCLQRMSGIATYTHKLSEILIGTNSRLLDTRKTTPNFRMCEKWAVAIGGGTNYRFGLFDRIMLKDNHIDYAGGIKNALTSTFKYLQEIKKDIEITIEVRTIEEVKEVIEIGGVQQIMLDNMSVEMMIEALKLINRKFKTEASGGITENNLKEIASTGVDFISIGALTHSAKSLDISLKAF